MSATVPGYKCFRYLVFSGDRLSGTTADYRIQVNPAFHSVAYVDWASSSVSGYLLQVPELRQHSRTSAETLYWRFINDNQNGRRMPFPEQTDQLYDLQSLSPRWLNPDGSVATDVPEHLVELEVYVLDA